MSLDNILLLIIDVMVSYNQGPTLAVMIGRFHGNG